MINRRKYIVGNWKMNGEKSQIDQVKAITNAASDYPALDVALCPPATVISSFANSVPSFAIGGQDCHMHEKGAYTGSVSASMLSDAGAVLTLVGHSERREAFGETDADINAKATAAMAAGLDVIICVGEPRSVREANEAESYVLAQLDGSLPSPLNDAEIAIAYEPIWAIGSGLTPTQDDIVAMHLSIRSKLMERYGKAFGERMRILYGGSVTGDNAAELLGLKNVDGALVGGASLSAAKFIPILDAVTRITTI